MKTLLDIVKYDLKKKTAKEWSSVCQKTGEGKDRFLVYVANNGKLKWYCRGKCVDCGKFQGEGDAIDYLMTFDGMKYGDACDYLGVPSTDRDLSYNPPILKQALFQREVWPCDAWTARAEQFVEAAHRTLMTCGAGKEYLAERGISEETAEYFRLGWVTVDRYDNKSLWGFPIEYNERTGKEWKIKLPMGLVLPIRREKGIVSITIRRTGKIEENGLRFWEVKRQDGCTSLHFVHGEIEKPIFIFESTIDAILCWQAQKGLNIASVMAESGKTKTPSKEIMNIVKRAPMVLLAHDNDEGGEDAVRRWQGYGLKNVFDARPPKEKNGIFCKDLGEYIKQGGNALAWMTYHILKHSS